MAGRAIRRAFGTPLDFDCLHPGEWRATITWGPALRIEKRRYEPGNPSGWYYFGPGAITGEYGGDYIEDAAQLAYKRATDAYHHRRHAGDGTHCIDDHCPRATAKSAGPTLGQPEQDKGEKP